MEKHDVVGSKVCGGELILKDVKMGYLMNFLSGNFLLLPEPKIGALVLMRKMPLLLL